MSKENTSVEIIELEAAQNPAEVLPLDNLSLALIGGGEVPVRL